MAFASKRIEVDDDPEELLRLINARGWGDGLPVVPPTEDRVEMMLRGRPPEQVVGLIPPLHGEATLEKVAVNAVLAGCTPDYFPVVVAAVEACLDPAFNLRGLQTTTHPCGILILCGGPLARELNIQSGAGCFGPGWPANASIGRAVRLTLQNLGGARPGELDRSTQGSPAKYTWCFAENEAASPWEPFHVARGFAAEDSTVTVCGAEGPHNVNDHASTSAAGILTTTADTMAVMGCNNLYARGEPMVVFGPEHAAILGAAGLSRADVQRALYAAARRPLRRVRQGGAFGMIALPESIDPADDSALVPVADGPDSIFVLVAGGHGRHSAFIPTFGLTHAVTRRIGSGACSLGAGPDCGCDI